MKLLTASNVSLIQKLLENIGIHPDSNAFTASSIIIALGVILMCGFLMTRLTKLLKLPSVIAYLLVGILIGPSVINLVPQQFIDRSSFISDVALVFVAFTAGEFFKLDAIKKNLGKAIAITAIESVATFALIFSLCFFVFRLEAPFSLVLASLASATAPTSTIMTIKQTESKGHYVTMLLEILAIDGVIALLLYTISISIFVGAANGGGSLSFTDVAWPLAKMLICLVIGVAFGFALKFLISSKRTTGNRLIIVVAVLLLFCGVCSIFSQSPLLGGIAIGTIYTNLCKTRDEEKLFAQVNYFMPPIMLVFFVRSGMSLNFSVFGQSSTLTAVPFIVIVIAFLFVRFAGKYGGTYLGSLATGQPKETRNFLGFGLIPQASVAIALTTMAVRTIETLPNPENYEPYTTALLAIILASSIIFELIGPVLAKLGLYASHSYGHDDINAVAPEHVVKDNVVEDEGSSKEIDLLAAQIKHISNEIKPLDPEEANEQAFTEAAEEYYENETFIRNHRGFINRK